MLPYASLHCSLHLLYGKNLAKALEVVDGGGIVCYEGARTRRRVFRVGRATSADCRSCRSSQPKRGGFAPTCLLLDMVA